MKVIIQLRHSEEVEASVSFSTFESTAKSIERGLSGVKLDYGFSSVQVPAFRPEVAGTIPKTRREIFAFSLEPKQSTYIVRGEIPESSEEQEASLKELRANPEVVDVFSDPQIESSPPTCGGDPPVGNDTQVAGLLNVNALASNGLNGAGVPVAIVDTGVSLAHLQSQGHLHALDTANSWTPAQVTTQPGQHAVDHGTMCAYDAGIAAPQATLLDHAVLLTRSSGATPMSGVLSDAVKSFSALLQYLRSNNPPPALVVSNSWGMYSPAWDFPVGQSGNYSDNLYHPFNIVVASLESAGADILFAAGNCGSTCPDRRCGFGQSLSICGANSHPKVITVAGIDVNKQWVGYSSEGPGRLYQRKPSLCAYTHFQGSRVYPADSGTSAACPVLAGVVAAVRTRYPSSALSPMQLRSILYKTAEDLGPTGFDFQHGWGTVNTPALLQALHHTASAAA